MPPEVQDTISAAQQMMDKINEKKKQFDEMIGEIKDELDELEQKYAGRSQQFIEDKKKELTEKLESKKEIMDKEIQRLTKIAQDWLNDKKEALIKKSTEAALKILTGISAPDIDPSDEN